MSGNVRGCEEHLERDSDSARADFGGSKARIPGHSIGACINMHADLYSFMF